MKNEITILFPVISPAACVDEVKGLAWWTFRPIRGMSWAVNNGLRDQIERR